MDRRDRERMERARLHAETQIENLCTFHGSLQSHFESTSARRELPNYAPATARFLKLRRFPAGLAPDETTQ